MTSQLPGDHGPCARRHGADLHAGAEYAPLPSCTLRANSIAEQQGLWFGCNRVDRCCAAIVRSAKTSSRKQPFNSLAPPPQRYLHGIAATCDCSCRSDHCRWQALHDRVPLGGIEPLSSCICSLLLNGVLLRMRSIKTSCVTRKLACSTFHVAPHCIALPGPGFLRVFQNALVVGQLRLHCGKIRRVAVEHLHQLPALADDLQVLPRCAVALRFFSIASICALRRVSSLCSNAAFIASAASKKAA